MIISVVAGEDIPEGMGHVLLDPDGKFYAEHGDSPIGLRFDRPRANDGSYPAVKMGGQIRVHAGPPDSIAEVRALGEPSPAPPSPVWAMSALDEIRMMVDAHLGAQRDDPDAKTGVTRLIKALQDERRWRNGLSEALTKIDAVTNMYECKLPGFSVLDNVERLARRYSELSQTPKTPAYLGKISQLVLEGRMTEEEVLLAVSIALQDKIHKAPRPWPNGEPF